MAAVAGIAADTAAAGIAAAVTADDDAVAAAAVVDEAVIGKGECIPTRPREKNADISPLSLA